MNVRAVRTEVIRCGDSLTLVLGRYLPKLRDSSVVVVTSKIVSVCENRILDKGSVSKSELIKSEADYFIAGDDREFPLTIKNNILIPSAGIDESNADGRYILWPKDIQSSANQIRSYLLTRDKIHSLGVIISDSKTTPLRSGTTGICLAFSGFRPVNSYIGKPDLFGRKLEVSKSNIADGLAAAAVLVMGEGSEQTPIAIITNIPFVEFLDRNPNQSEIDSLSIKINDDIYSPLLRSVKWESQTKYHEK